jgi:uncharacterized protein YoxC
VFTQVKPFNVASAGTTKYLCLQNVRLGYGISALYLTATKAWNGTQQHADRNFPAGCSVPVFWSLFLTLDGVYADYGHVAVRLADGRIWTDGRYYANVDELNSSYLGGKGKYLGWGESLNNVKVIGESMAENITDDVARQIGWHYLGRNGFDGKPNALQSAQGDLQGKPLTNAQLSAFFLSAESRDWRDSRIHKVYGERDALRTANTNLNAQVTQLTKAVADKQKTIDLLNAQVLGLNQTINEKQAEIDTLADANADLKKENDELKAQLATCGDSEDTDFLNKLGELLRWLIARLGLRK